MNRVTTPPCLVAALPLLLVGCAARHADFGEPLKLSDRDTIPLAKVLADPEKFSGRTIRVSGTVKEVCQNKGCWINLADGPGGDTVHVKFVCPIEDERLIPLEAVGHKAVVEGVLVIEEISQDIARHHAEDAGKSPEEIARIVGPQRQLRIKAPAARIVGIEAPPRTAKKAG